VLKDFLNIAKIVIVSYYSPNPAILEVEDVFLKEEYFKTNKRK